MKFLNKNDDIHYMGFAISRINQQMPALAIRQQALNGLGQLIGPERAARLLEHFLWNPQRGRFSCQEYERNPSEGIYYKKFKQLGQRNSPLVLGSVAELDQLEFYILNQVAAELYGLEEDKPLPLPYLANYLLIPTQSGRLVFLVDDHNHAAFATALMAKVGVIRPGALFINIDRHEDNELNRQNFKTAEPIATLQEIADFTRNSLEICSYIEFLCRQQVGELIGHKWHGRAVAFVQPFYEGKGVIKPTYYFDNDHPDKMALTDGAYVSLERTQELIDEARRGGQSVTCSICLDYFGGEGVDFTDNAFTSAYPFEERLRLITAIAKQADFTIIATSPNWFFQVEANGWRTWCHKKGFAPVPPANVKYLLKRLIAPLDQA